jgi:hypothetical protein
MPNRTVTARRTGVGVDTTDFRLVAKALRRAAPDLAKGLRADLRVAGLEVAAKAKAIAEENSEKIAGTIKVRVASTTVAVVAGGEGVPEAALFELGNTGGRRSAAASGRGTFRHPVFGNRDVWVNQDMHPFLAPAAASEMPRFEANVSRTLDRVTRTIVEGR